MSETLNLKLFNTLSKKIETFVPIDPPQVGFYACGPTVYDYTHLGHLRRYTMDDVLVRLLRSLAFQVKFVQNVTDVGHLSSDADTGEDKLEKGAKKYQQSVWQIAAKFEEYFFRSNDRMGNLRPDISCRATDHIQEQIELVKTLESKGVTYVIPNDGVYFDTSQLADYGKLASQKLDQLLAGARVEVVAGKRQATDFALWKFEKPGENRAMSWPSPWSEKGFPGWHLECSAMSQKYLGDQFDIHTGGVDHIAVHHTNEIAQSETATGKKPFVRFWLHHNVMMIDGQKMSKSLNNFYTIDDVVKKGFHPRALRLLFMTAHYRSELNFTWENLAGMQSAYEKLLKEINHWQATSEKVSATILSAQAKDFKQAFWQHLANDLDTPQALAVVWQMVKADLSAGEKLYLIEDFEQILQLDLVNAEQILAGLNQKQELRLEQLPKNVQELVAARAAARAEKNYQLADQLRQALAQLGYRILDQAKKQKVIYDKKNS